MIKKILIFTLLALMPINAFAFDKDSFIDAYSGIRFKKLNNKTYLAVFAVTQEQWYKVMGTAPFTFNRGGNYPAETVSIGDIQKFLNILNDKTKSAYRLPTVSEWREATGEIRLNRDNACSIANLYDISGNEANRYGNAYFECDDKFPNTSPAGSFPANAQGFYDMIGNVKEWCCNSENDRTNSCASLLGAASLAVAGGGFSDGPKEMKKFIKDERTSLRFAGLGFRLAIYASDINQDALYDPSKPQVIAPAKTETPIQPYPDEENDNKSSVIINGERTVTGDGGTAGKPYENNNYESSSGNRQPDKPQTQQKQEYNKRQENNGTYQNNYNERDRSNDERKFKFLPFLRD